jgi:hypothetical protein
VEEPRAVEEASVEVDWAVEPRTLEEASVEEDSVEEDSMEEPHALEGAFEEEPQAGAWAETAVYPLREVLLPGGNQPSLSSKRFVLSKEWVAWAKECHSHGLRLPRQQQGLFSIPEIPGSRGQVLSPETCSPHPPLEATR